MNRNGGYSVRKFITVLLMLALLVMPGTQGLLAQGPSENALQNEVTLPQIEASNDQLVSSDTSQEQVPDEQEQIPDEQEEIPDDQGEISDEQETIAPDGIGTNEELNPEHPPFAKKSLTLEEKNEEIDKVLREVSANATGNERIDSAKIATPTAMSPPIYVWIASDLYNIRNNLSGHYVQMADIDLSDYPNWDPIDMFNGTYDGNGFSITNLTIDRSTEDRIGLFGDLSNTTNCSLQNINLVNVSVSGRQYVGGLVGFTADSTLIKNCTVKGLIKGEDAFVGGIAGE